MKKRMGQIFACMLTAALCTGCGQTAQETTERKSSLDSENPVSITMWHYYNGAQQDALVELTDEFNETIGSEKGIKVEISAFGDVTEISKEVSGSFNKTAGAKEQPDIFAAYPDTAYEFNQQGKLVDLNAYLTEEEKQEYVDGFIEEGDVAQDGTQIVFPIAKSVELFMLNKTDWDKFAQATGADVSELATIEGVTDIAQQYYEWTDSLTEEANDGKAFYGRDSMGNYFYIGFRELGQDMVTVEDGQPVLNFDREIMKKLWDNYYIPYIKGYFASSGRFRSDDIKTGNIIAFTGSSSGASFFPDQVTLSDTESYAIEMQPYEAPKFKNGENYAVQQGAGMVVTKSDDQKQEASVEFLKWLTDTAQNNRLSSQSGYLPVKKEASEEANVEVLTEEKDQNIQNIVQASANTINDNKMYVTPVYKSATDLRLCLDSIMSDQAAADREIVLSNLASGMSYEEACASFVTEDNFNTWYENTKTQLEKIISE